MEMEEGQPVPKGISASREGQKQWEGSKAELLSGDKVIVEQLKGGNGNPGVTRKDREQKTPGKAQGCSAVTLPSI